MTNAAATTTTLRFEREICSRCCGTGHYSYNQISGTTCFKCGGAREALTPRASVAMAWMRAQRSVKADDLVLGQRVEVTGIGKFTITQLEYVDGGASHDYATGVWERYAALHISGSIGGAVVPLDHAVMVILPAAEHNALLAKAIEYQNSLPVQPVKKARRK